MSARGTVLSASTWRHEGEQKRRRAGSQVGAQRRSAMEACDERRTCVAPRTTLGTMASPYSPRARKASFQRCRGRGQSTRESALQRRASVMRAPSAACAARTLVPAGGRTSTHRHQVQPGLRPLKPYSGRGVLRSLPRRFEKSRNVGVRTAASVCLPGSPGCDLPRGRGGAGDSCSALSYCSWDQAQKETTHLQ